MTEAVSLAEKPHTLAHQTKKFDALCLWIEEHLAEPIGWQELLKHGGGLDFHAINALFFRHKSTTPMTWIRRRREARAGGAGK